MLVQLSVARIDGPQGTGEYAIFVMLVLGLATLSHWSIPQSLSVYAASQEEHGRAKQAGRALTGTLLLTVAIAVVLAGLLALIPRLLPGELRFGLPEGAIALVAIALVFSTIVNITALFQQGLLSFSSSALILCAVPFFTLVALWCLKALAMDVGTYVPGTIGYVSAGVLGLLLCVQRRSFEWQISWAVVREVLKYSLPSLSFVYLSFITHWLDRLILATLVDPFQFGLIVAAMTLVQSGLRLVSAFTLMPSFSKAEVRGKREVEQLLNVQIKLASTVLMTASLGLVAFGDMVIVGLYGSSFAPAATLLRILAGQLVLASIGQPALALLTGIGQARLTSRLLVPGIPLQLALLVGLTLTYGPVGAALAVVLVEAYYASGYVVAIVRVLKMRLDLGTMGRTALCLLLCAAVTMYLSVQVPGAPLALALPILGFAVVSLAAITQEERDMLLRAAGSLRP